MEMAAENTSISVRQYTDDDIQVHCNALKDEYGVIARHSRHIIGSMLCWDREGWLTADVDGQPAGFIGCVRFNDEYAMIGFYVVVKEFRGLGAGKKLWKAVTSLCGSRNVIVNAVEPEHYVNKGISVVRSRYYGCIGPAWGPEGKDEIAQLPSGYKMKLYNENDFKPVLFYDTAISPHGERENFLQHHLHPSASTTYLVLDKESRVSGYGCIQPIDTGLGSYSIGPLYADTDQIAESLLAILLTVPDKGRNVCVDVYTQNEFAVRLVHKYNMPAVEEFVSIFMRQVDYTISPKVYGVTSPCICLS